MPSDWTTTTSSPPGPNTIPDKSFQRSTNPRVLEAKFGDGYSQRVADGLNTIMESWGLSFQNRSMVDINTMRAFLESKKGVFSFTWDPPGQVANTTKSITGVVSGAGGKYQITSATHGFINGTEVVITGVLGTTGANGTWLIEGVTANNFLLSGSTFAGTYTAATGTVTIPPIKVVCKDWRVSVLFTQSDLVTGFGTLDCTFERVYE